MTTTQSKAEILSLTGLRGLAAYAVVLAHVDRALGLVIFPAQAFVDIFFVLSGFVISYNYIERERLDAQNYFIARFSRIYPLFVATTIAVLGMYLAQSIVNNAPLNQLMNSYDILAHILLVMAMPGFEDARIWNAPSWSISVEWWSYFLVFPLLYVIHKTEFRKVTAAGVYLIICGMFIYLQIAQPEEVTKGWIAWGRAALGFSAGWVAYLAFKAKTPVLADRPGLATVTSILALIVINAFFMVYDQNIWIVSAVFPVIVVGLALNPKSLVARLLSTRLMKVAGDISYSVYLIHPIVISGVLFLSAFLGPAVNDPYVFAAMVFIITTLLSIASFHLLERPSQAGLRKVLSRPARAA